MPREFLVIPGRPARVKEFENHPVGYEQLTVSNTAVALASVPLNANRAIIVVEGKHIRWRIDGTDPTSTVGMKGFANSTIILESRLQINKFKAIRLISSDAKLSTNYYERK